MVGEFVFLSDISNFCQWTNTLLVAVSCIPFVLVALLHKLIPLRRGGRFTLEWKEDYFERGFHTSNQPEADSQKKNRPEVREKQVPLPGLRDRQQDEIKKQAE